MATLTRAQIAGHAQAAGFTGNDVNIAVAVALAESGGDPRAHNPVPPDNSYGLWQINMLGSMGPERRKRFGLKSNEDLYDPATHARAAYGIWKAQGWSRGWTTDSAGSDKRFRILGPDAVSGSDTSANATTGSDTSAGVDIPSGLGIGDAIARGANALSLSMFKGIANVSGILLAATLIVIGLVVLLRERIPVKGIAKAAKKVVK